MALSLASIDYIHSLRFAKGLDQQGPYYEVEYQIGDWANADAFANALMGVGTTAPHKYPGSENCLCQSARVLGKGRVALSVDGTPSYNDGAIIQAIYRSGSFGGFDYTVGNEHQIDPGTPILWCTQELDYKTEAMALPYRNLYWSSDLKPADVNAPKQTHSTMMILTFHRRRTIPISTIRACRGKLNASTFLGAAAECVLFHGARTTREIARDGSVEQKVQLILEERDQSWNKFYRHETDTWDYLTNGVLGDVLFSTADFAPLLAIP